MKLPFTLLLMLLSFSLTAAVEADIDCPDEVVVGAEFVCQLDARDVDQSYDLKIELKDGTKTIAKIFSPAKDSWSSAYYYLKGFIDDDSSKEIKLKIEKEGSFQGSVKLRSNTPKEVATFEITAVAKDSEKENDVSNNEIKESNKPKSKIEKEPVKEDSPKESFVQLDAKPIQLNQITLESKVEEPIEAFVYESKSRKIISYAPYAFSLFLILIIAVLAIQRAT